MTIAPGASLDFEADRQVADLLREGIEGACRDGIEMGPFAVGPYRFRLVAPPSSIMDRLCRHLVPSDPTHHDLTIFVRDEEAASHPPRWNLPHADVRHLERLHLAKDNSLAAQYDADRELWWILDRSSRTGLLWIGDLNALPDWEVAAPFRSLLSWFLAPTPMAMLHAGAVATNAGAALLIGQGGAGKSTTVAACLSHGFEVCGDDLVVVGREHDHVGVFALYDSIKLDPRAPFAAHLGFAGQLGEPCVDKVLYRYTDVAPTQFAPQAKLRAVIRTSVSHQPETTIRPDTPARALRALAPSTAFLLRGSESQSIARCVDVVRSLPTFEMQLSDDPAEAAAVLARWFEATF